MYIYDDDLGWIIRKKHIHGIMFSLPISLLCRPTLIMIYFVIENIIMIADSLQYVTGRMNTPLIKVTMPSIFKIFKINEE